MEDKKILEALQVQPLSEEEKTSRHILGRLYGPIATCVESTRNGRTYNRQLWETALNDEIFKEKVANKSLFLELGHPADREETVMAQACACIPELPKIVGDDLYAYVDILDTPNGRLLKTFIDYGFKPGISSRGSGDIMANNEVDPETFFLETWDIVQLPAVKKARLTVCESLEADQLKLKKALCESLNNASEEDKSIMKEALDNLDIDVENATEENLDEAVGPNDPWAKYRQDFTYGEPKPYVDEMVEESLTEAKEDEEDKEDEIETVDEVEADDTEAEDSAEDTADKIEVSEDDEVVKDPAATLGDFLDQFKDYDKDLPIEFKPISVEGNEIAINELAIDSSEEGKLVIEIGYDSAMSDTNTDVELPEDDNPEVDIAIDSNGETIVPEASEAPEEANDAGDEEVIESLMEMIRQKDSLETEVKSLKEDKTVSDAKVAKLEEELRRYKEGFSRMSELAAKSNKFEKEVQALTEQLNNKDTQLKNLQMKTAETVKLTEGMNDNARQVKALKEEVNRLTEESEASSRKLTEQKEAYEKKLAEKTEVAKGYKAKFTAVLNRYVESKASMLGVRTSDIISRLGEDLSLTNIDAVCEKMLNESVAYSKLPFAGKNATVKPTSKKKVEVEVDPFSMDW